MRERENDDHEICEVLATSLSQQTRLTVVELLKAFKGDFKLKRIQKGRGVVENGHVDQIHQRHRFGF
jgi:hypothetical protein